MAAAVMMVACSSTPQTPTSPSAGLGGSMAAAADGSTLKVTAPSLLDPTGEARVETRRPTLAWTASTGTYTSNVSPSYEVEVSTGGTVVYNVTVAETTHQVNIEAEFDTAYSWRVRARQEGAAGPWSASATFLSPLPGGGVTTGYRTPNPPPGSRLPLPNESGIVFDEYNNNRDDWRNSCQERLHERGWIWLDKLVDRLRTERSALGLQRQARQRERPVARRRRLPPRRGRQPGQYRGLHHRRAVPALRQQPGPGVARPDLGHGGKPLGRPLDVPATRSDRGRSVDRATLIRIEGRIPEGFGPWCVPRSSGPLYNSHPMAEPETFYKSFSEKKLTGYGSGRRSRIEQHRLAPAPALHSRRLATWWRWARATAPSPSRRWRPAGATRRSRPARS